MLREARARQEVQSGGKVGRVGCCTDREGRPKAVDARPGGPSSPPQELAREGPLGLNWLVCNNITI